MAKETREKKMRGLTPWEPHAGVPRWEQEMEGKFWDLLEGESQALRDERWWPGNSLQAREPAIDLYRENDEIVAKAELPGMKKDDIQVNITDSLLTISGEKKKEEESKAREYYQSERLYGSFMRKLSLPSRVNPEKARATYENGVLEIHLTKTDETKKRKVRIKLQ